MCMWNVTIIFDNHHVYSDDLYFLTVEAHNSTQAESRALDNFRREMGEMYHVLSYNAEKVS